LDSTEPGTISRRLTPDEEWEELKKFDWDPSKLTPPPKSEPKPMMTLGDVSKAKIDQETFEQRATRMLRGMHTLVNTCSMCSLGKKLCSDRDSIFDPHVFSNMKPSRWMVIGQNPGFNEVLQHEPFVGDAGKAFANELKKYGLWRSDFYITNAVKCYTIQNAKPDRESMSACESILRLEIQLLKPHFVVALGSVAFESLCPDLDFTPNLGKIVESTKFGIKVFPVYHPSPRNLNNSERKEKFIKDVRILSKLILAMKAAEGTPKVTRSAEDLLE
jgi:uracil-DNA glycosylase family 4